MDLQTILAEVRNESEQRKKTTSLKSLKHKVKDLPPTLGFEKHIREQPFSIIAEIKSKSPSMGPITNEKTVNEAHLIYQRSPIVSAISVLTQCTQFGGTEARLRLVRRHTRKPILRKDFLSDEYEIYFSRYIGADAVLLMANVVTDKSHFSDLHDLATDLGMDVLCEFHSEEELELLPKTAKICGINSRRFKDSNAFMWSKVGRHVGKDTTTDLAAFDLFDKLPAHALKVAESGMTSQNLKTVLEKYPFNAALIGTALMKGDTQQELNLLQTAVRGVKFNHSVDNIHNGKLELV